jgi:hypothetical protein
MYALRTLAAAVLASAALPVAASIVPASRRLLSGFFSSRFAAPLAEKLPLLICRGVGVEHKHSDKLPSLWRLLLPP